MQQNLVVNVNDLASTETLARAVAERLRVNAGGGAQVIALSGTLGAGKTQWTRYFCESLGVPAGAVTSPTYVLLQRHAGDRLIYHFDFYRLDNEAQVWDLGIDELFEQPVVIVIEWADKFPACLPDDHLAIVFDFNNQGDRRAQLKGGGFRSQAMIEMLADGDEMRPLLSCD